MGNLSGGYKATTSYRLRTETVVDQTDSQANEETDRERNSG